MLESTLDEWHGISVMLPKCISFDEKKNFEKCRAIRLVKIAILMLRVVWLLYMAKTQW